jgi:hypothetical protein
MVFFGDHFTRNHGHADRGTTLTGIGRPPHRPHRFESTDRLAGGLGAPTDHDRCGGMPRGPQRRDPEAVAAQVQGAATGRLMIGAPAGQRPPRSGRPPEPGTGPPLGPCRTELPTDQPAHRCAGGSQDVNRGTATGAPEWAPLRAMAAQAQAATDGRRWVPDWGKGRPGARRRKPRRRNFVEFRKLERPAIIFRSCQAIGVVFFRKITLPRRLAASPFPSPFRTVSRACGTIPESRAWRGPWRACHAVSHGVRSDSPPPE